MFVGIRKKQLELSQSAHTPTQRLVTEQVLFYRKKKMEVPKLQEKSLHLQRALTSKIVGI